MKFHKLLQKLNVYQIQLSERWLFFFFYFLCLILLRLLFGIFWLWWFLGVFGLSDLFMLVANELYWLLTVIRLANELYW